MRTPRAAAISRATAVTIVSGDTRRSPLAGMSAAVTTCRMRNLHCNEKKVGVRPLLLLLVCETGMESPFGKTKGKLKPAPPRYKGSGRSGGMTGTGRVHEDHLYGQAGGAEAG